LVNHNRLPPSVKKTDCAAANPFGALVAPRFLVFDILVLVSLHCQFFLRFMLHTAREIACLISSARAASSSAIAGMEAIKEIAGITGDALHPFNPFYRFYPFHRFHPSIFIFSFLSFPTDGR
jgi:hypothetical protein